MKFTPSHTAVVLAFLAGLITACNLTSNASSGSGTSGIHVQLFHVTGVKSDQARTTDAYNPTGSGAQPDATVSASGSPIGTVASWLVSDNNGGFVPVSESAATFVQSHSTANSTLATFKMSDGTMQPEFPLYYTSNDCTLGANEVPYAGGNWVGYTVTTEGITFRDQVGNDSDASTYWYLAPGTAISTVNVNSSRVPPDGHCVAGSQPGLLVFKTVQNTQALSGYANAPVGALGVD